MNRISFAAVLACTALIACKGGETDTSGGEECTNTYRAFPESGVTNAYYRTTVEATLQVADAAATLAVDAGGTAVAGEVEVIGTRIVFTPSAPLAPSTAYTATLTAPTLGNPDRECVGTSSWTFTTSEVGGAVSGSLIGNTYSLDLTSGRFVKPEGVGDLLEGFLTTQVLVGVTASDTTSIDMIGAIAVEGSDPAVQDMCTESIAFPTADFTGSPYFSIDATEPTPITVAGYTVNIDDLELSGAFAPDASYIAGARLAGGIDTRPLVTLLTPDCTSDNTEIYPDCLGDVCEFAEMVGGCVPCADTQEFCLELEVDSIGAEKVDGLTLEVVTPDDIAADTNCAEDTDTAN